jgi:hypothetical protein
MDEINNMLLDIVALNKDRDALFDKFDRDFPVQMKQERDLRKPTIAEKLKKEKVSKLEQFAHVLSNIKEAAGSHYTYLKLSCKYR